MIVNKREDERILNCGYILYLNEYLHPCRFLDNILSFFFGRIGSNIIRHVVLEMNFYKHCLF